jgi:hypothetical protein
MEPEGCSGAGGPTKSAGAHQAAERGFRRLDAALHGVGPKLLTQILRSLKLQLIDRVDSLQALYQIVLALEAVGRKGQ